MTSLQILFVVTTLSFTVQTLAASCPKNPTSGCRCSEPPVTFECIDLNLRVLPSQVSNDTEELIFDGNRIETIRSGMFKRLTKLRRLSLSGNEIWKIADDAFTGLTKLKKLELGNNLLRTVPKAVKVLPQLEVLDLNFNRITEIEDGTFANMTSLTSLRLYNNQLTSIGANVVKDLKNGTEIRLYGNQWRCDCDLFEAWKRFKQPKFEVWYPKCSSPPALEGRTWKSLSEDDFCPENVRLAVKCPKTLMSSGCQCYEPPLEFWCNNLNLNVKVLPTDVSNDTEELHFNGNGIENIDSGMFKRLTKLRNLTVYHNEISTIADDAFTSLSQLKTLNLARNLLTAVPEAVKVLTQLEYLDVSYNFISVIEDDTFAKMTSLQILELNDNQLTSIGASVVKDLKVGIEIRLNDNPWRCNCDLFEAWKRFKQPEFDVWNPRCSSPPALEERTWNSLKLSEFCPEYVSTTTSTSTKEGATETTTTQEAATITGTKTISTSTKGVATETTTTQEAATITSITVSSGTTTEFPDTSGWSIKLVIFIVILIISLLLLFCFTTETGSAEEKSRLLVEMDESRDDSQSDASSKAAPDVCSKDVYF